MKYRLLFALFLTNIYINHAQETVHIDMDTVVIGTFDECYKILRDNYVIMLKSEPNQKYQAAVDELIEKSNYFEIYGDYAHINILELVKWMQSNIEKTDFKDYNAVLAQKEKMDKASRENILANLDLHKYSKEAGRVYGAKLLTKVADELTPIYGAKFHF